MQSRFFVNAFFIFFTSTAILGCASTTPNVAPKITDVDIPQIGETNTIKVGESAVQKARVYAYEAYELLQEVEVKWVGSSQSIDYTLTLAPGIYAATRKDQKNTYFIAVGDFVEICGFISCSRKPGGFIIAADTGEIRVYERSSMPRHLLREPPDWRRTTYASIDEPSFRQELIYNGRSGSTVRFLYREFSRDMIRPAFSQELTYDLDEGSEIGFRGVRIEIIHATNILLTYRVDQSFPDRD
jgi:hypothetical protein